MNGLSRDSRLIKNYPVADVTSRFTDAEIDPREVGMTQSQVDTIWQAVEKLYETRLYPALCLSLRRGGKVLIQGAIGHTTGNCPDQPDAPLVQATPDTLFSLFSASKSITAMLIHLLNERGLVHLDDPVVEYIPEFGKHGKHWITIRHLLTHKAGIPTIKEANFNVDLLSDYDAIMTLLCDAEPLHAPGRRVAYHALTGGYVLGEIVRRVTGRNVRQFLGEEVLDRLGIKHLNYGVSTEDIPKVARHAFTGARPPWPVAQLMKNALGVKIEEAVRISNDPRFMTSIIPAGNITGTADEACRFFEMLLRGGTLDGAQILERRTVQRSVAEQTYLQVDWTLGFPVRYGMGFMLGGEHINLFGPKTSRLFGHLGFTNVVCWADPGRDISGCIMTSGKPFISLGVLRWIALMWCIAKQVPRI